MSELAVTVGCSLLLLPALALAGAPAVEATRSISVPTPQDLVVPTVDPNPRTPGPTVVFLNLDGAPINANGEDSRTNSSFVAGDYGFAGSYPPWGGSVSQRQSLLDAVRADWAPFDFVITDSRPAAGNYTMAMHGPVNHPLGPGTVGIAPVDCYDNNQNNVVFAFYSAADLGANGPLGEQATTISQEIAHSYGLEHVAGNGAQGDIMFPTTSSNASFLDTCFPITGTLRCSGQHAELSGCGGGDVQNGVAELLSLFGAANPDTEDPSVTITAPADGTTLPVGADFEINVEASDDVQVVAVELFVNDYSIGIIQSPPYVWPAHDIPEGSHELYAIATDPTGNEAESAVVTIHATPDGDPGGDDGAFPGDSFPPGYGDEARDGGCSCRAGASPTPASLLMLVVFACRRRRAEP